MLTVGKVNGGGKEELIKPEARKDVLKLVMKTVGVPTGRGAVLQWVFIRNIDPGLQEMFVAFTSKLKDTTALPAETVQPLVDENLGGSRFTARGNLSKAWMWEAKICLKLQSALETKFWSPGWGSGVKRFLLHQCIWQKTQCEILCWTHPVHDAATG